MIEVGASDVGNICGVGFKTPFAAWMDFVYGREESDDPLLKFGLKIEPLLLDFFSEYKGITYDAVQPQIKREMPGGYTLRATPDAVFSGGVVEAKTSVRRRDWESGPPLKYIYQVMVQMNLFEKEKAFIPVYFESRIPSVFEVTYEDWMFQEIIGKVDTFVEMVRSGEFPELRLSDSPFLARVYEDEGSTKDLGEDGRIIVNELKDLKKRRSMIDDMIGISEMDLKKLLGKSSIGTVDGEVVCTWKEYVTERLDSKRIESEFPDITAQFKNATTSRRLVIK